MRPHYVESGIVPFSTETTAPRVAVIVDTSASMGPQQLAQALSAVDTVVRELGSPLDVYTADVAVNGVTRAVTSSKNVKLVGGGGTDMGAAIALVLKKRYQAVVVITDGYTPWPSERIRSATIVAIITSGGDAKTPDWMPTIVLDEDGRGRIRKGASNG